MVQELARRPDKLLETAAPWETDASEAAQPSDRGRPLRGRSVWGMDGAVAVFGKTLHLVLEGAIVRLKLSVFGLHSLNIELKEVEVTAGSGRRGGDGGKVVGVVGGEVWRGGASIGRWQGDGGGVVVGEVE